MRKLFTLLGLGAAGMYYFDPQLGRRRRHLLRDRAAHTFRSGGEFFERAARDLEQRAGGLVCQMESLLESHRPTDAQLAERVRSKLGRCVSHPGALEVTADGGYILLSGRILADEVEPLVAAVAAVPGVEKVETELEAHERAEHISDLQGGVAPRGEPRFWRKNLPPGARLLVCGAGMVLTGYSLARHRSLATWSGLLGAAAALRGATNLQPQAWFSSREAPARRILKTYHLSAPVERVYEFIEAFENFPRFMPHLKKVERLGENRLRWTAATPVGGQFQWEELITARAPNECIAFRSAPESPLHYQGVVHLTPEGESACRVDLQLTYRPPGGQIGQWLAELMGLDPKTQIETAIRRIRTHLEEASVPTHSAVEKSKG